MKIYNSLTRGKDEFTPLKEKKVGMYVCGPTVYDEPHIGHARSAYIFDVVRRYFIYKGYAVKFVRNVTDVDDKIIAKAKSSKDTVSEVSKKYLEAYHRGMELLGIGAPDVEPKATEYIPKMIKYIARLVKNGCAYEAGGDVYFDIKKAKGYGKLSNQNLEKMESGARIAPGEKKRDPLDFALWKKAKEDEPSWDSPWGKGRPGWHIECSVMSSDILGPEFDIHGGGIDLIFPHHENEIAQSEGAGDKFARYWMHNGLLTINGEKMAKSLGNFISIQDLLKKYHEDVIKLFFLRALYASPIDFSEDKMVEETGAYRKRFLNLFFSYESLCSNSSQSITSDEMGYIDHYKARFIEAMDDDFNTPKALAVLFDIVSYSNSLLANNGQLRNSAKIKYSMQLLQELLTKVFGFKLNKDDVMHDGRLRQPESGFGEIIKDAIAERKEIDSLIEKRNELRKQKKFTEADAIRKELEKRVILKDKKDGTTDWSWR